MTRRGLTAKASSLLSPARRRLPLNALRAVQSASPTAHAATWLLLGRVEKRPAILCLRLQQHAAAEALRISLETRSRGADVVAATRLLDSLHLCANAEHRSA